MPKRTKKKKKIRFTVQETVMKVYEASVPMDMTEEDVFFEVDDILCDVDTELISEYNEDVEYQKDTMLELAAGKWVRS